ncbi:DUF924 domain-containing protein [Ponticoccus sp. SC2-23]|uniref:DUF924 family protein n=1 Tax=Alexandriicola marinus TaxID=2081710 RepID=UPI000FDC0AA1|nr:DUF924 family protein [Alexandriicola marinus]MBM1219296.1 DUF924 domain-containing protein [Ponticoccus sp. SC6-9]MBM1223632.1 DUF924 domain-containing protein [Ponticoccus sp. SC6-15]MBM1229109.1 DUF924 domain-containing protein [Ponticoccus sp. SC6-38]MBM1232598.1 DUF924 domain-containing protein [Ponticoccus sp. SC6-45]MBM1237452.1 DUF924 domain-containing protein [Ponticoccus sp. SC6-49]MBM1241609.1 DUF924 domain-containing protein [Ponticoccus sp. SC2-64]MBM1246122.1 DUF924 domain-c
MANPETILNFWIDEVGPSGWYSGEDALNAEIRDKFEDDWNKAMAGSCGLWLTSPQGALAYLILVDQFPRNMFKGTGKSFASDRQARAAAKTAIARKWDLRIPEPQRQFFYMPLMHSENLIDQDRAVRLFLTRMPETGEQNLPHARAHREIIRRFGRFPTRNAALARSSTAAEQAWIDEGGYGRELRELAGAA